MNQFEKKNVMHNAHDLIEAFVKQSPGHENWRIWFVCVSDNYYSRSHPPLPKNKLAMV